jgi:hypothetical protein
MNTTRRTAAVVASVTAAASIVSIAPAQAAAADKSRITVRASDYEVLPGQQFVLRGRMTSLGDAVNGATVRVQGYRNGGWHNLKGAVVRTSSEGRYRVRVILSSGGDRDLRVVADPAGDAIRKARGYTVVRVLG